MREIVDTIPLTEEESLEIEENYYKLEALKNLFTDINMDILNLNKEKYDQIVDRYVTAYMAYNTSWSLIVGKKIPIEYSTLNYDASINFNTHTLEISKINNY